MARYPELSNLVNLSTKEVKDLYNEMQRWGATLLNELDARDAQVDNRPSTTIRVAVTSGSITNPQKGDVVYSTSSGKYKGFVSTAASTTFKAFF
jgi:hypothetical protein